ncbi:MAG: hypothetical protein HY296_07995 [Thaumarchaeota archaeon]|nr:hypothetical protein [Nitrososphaerota archaeon]
MKCRLCKREAISEFCRFHQEAKVAVEVGYEKWVRAYGTLDMKSYLHRVIASSETGQWSKEIARYLEGMRDDKTDS